MRHLIGSALLALGLILTATVDSSARGGLRRVIISTDLATGLQNGWRAGVNDIDDGLAVGMALADRSLDVRGVVVTFGNNDMEPEKLVGDRLVRDLMRSDVPVLRGAAAKLSDPQVAWYDETPAYEACLNEGVRFMASKLRRGALAVIAIGPLTDVACLVQNFPAEAQNISEVIVIMGRSPHQSLEIGPVSGLTDFNYVMDTRAAQIVLEASSLPVTFMTFTLTSSALVPRAALEALRQKDSALARFVVQASEPWVQFWQKTFNEDGFHPWDQNAVYYASHPSAFTCEGATAQIVACPSGPYHKDADNPCVDHGPDQKTSLDKESSQLWLSPGAPSRLKMCTSYANAQAKQDFLNAIFEFVR